MKELLDQIENNASTNEMNGPFKTLSIALLAESVLIVLYTFFIINYDVNNPESPWLPVFTPYFVHSALINFAVVQFGGVIPSLFLFWKKKYVASSFVMIAFLVIARLLEHFLDFHYWLAFH